MPQTKAKSLDDMTTEEVGQALGDILSSSIETGSSEACEALAGILGESIEKYCSTQARFEAIFEYMSEITAAILDHDSVTLGQAQERIRLMMRVVGITPRSRGSHDRCFVHALLCHSAEYESHDQTLDLVNEIAAGLLRDEEWQRASVSLDVFGRTARMYPLEYDHRLSFTGLAFQNTYEWYEEYRKSQGNVDPAQEGRGTLLERLAAEQPDLAEDLLYPRGPSRMKNGSSAIDASEHSLAGAIHCWLHAPQDIGEIGWPISGTLDQMKSLSIPCMREGQNNLAETLVDALHERVSRDHVSPNVSGNGSIGSDVDLSTTPERSVSELLECMDWVASNVPEALDNLDHDLFAVTELIISALQLTSHSADFINYNTQRPFGQVALDDLARRQALTLDSEKFGDTRSIDDGPGLPTL